MKKTYFFLAVLFLIQFCPFAQQNKYIDRKSFTKSEDILKAITESHNKNIANDSMRTTVATKVLDNGYVMESKMGQYWDADNATWVNSSMELNTYNTEGLRIEQINQYWTDGAWLNADRYLTTYHSGDLVALLEEKAWNGSAWVDDYNYASTYDANNNVTEYNVTQWTGTEWLNLYKTSYTYYENGNLQMVAYLNWNGTSWDNSYRDSYTYNANDDVVIRLEENWTEGAWVNAYKDTNIYNAQNQLVDVIVSWWPGTAWEANVEHLYTYNSGGNVEDYIVKFWEPQLGLQNHFHWMYQYLPGTTLRTQEIYEEWNLGTSQWVTNSRVTNTYNNQNSIEHFLLEGWNSTSSTWFPASQEIYTFDEHGNHSTHLNQYHNGTEWVSTFIERFTWAVPTPVELTSFSAAVSGTDVTLSWTTATETNNRGFEIERAADGKEFSAAGFIAGHGTTTESQEYSFKESDMQTGNYTYRLKQTDFDGTFEYSNEIKVAVSTPSVYSLDQNYPNPFNPSTKIAFNLAFDANVSLTIYDILGNEVTKLVNGNLKAGAHEVQLNASQLTSGVYFYRLNAVNPEDNTSFSSVKKMTLLK